MFNDKIDEDSLITKINIFKFKDKVHFSLLFTNEI